MTKDITKNKILIVADRIVDRKFCDIIKYDFNTNVDLCYFDSTVARRHIKCFRHLGYFISAIRAFKRRNDYRSIVFWQQFIGIYYGLLCSVLGVKVFPPSIVLQFIFKRRQGISGWIQKNIFRYSLDACALNYFICNSSGEKIYYAQQFGNNRAKKIIFKALGYDIKKHGLSGNFMPYQKKDYFFSGGTSNRDYLTLLKAFEGTNECLVIASLTRDMKGLKVGDNVKVFHNAFGEDFIELMANAYAVIIPLNNPDISSGQLVLLTAMFLGKPIIITNGGCVRDYVDEDCALLVRDHSVVDIKKSVAFLLQDRLRASDLAQKAAKRYEESFTLTQYAKRISAILRT